MIKINNNEFNDGDQITFLYDDVIIQGEIHIPDDDEYFILHNERSYWYDDVPIKTDYKYAWFFSLEDEIDNQIFHRINVEKNFKYDEDFSQGVRFFLINQPINLYSIFSIKLPSISKYDSITESTSQGSVELHSSVRNKKLTVKLGRLTRKLIKEFNEKLKTNPKNNKLDFLDKNIEKIHNEWMAAHASEVKYQILSGEDILKGYSSKYYCEGQGSLHNSCMTDKKDFLKIYTQNKENIFLLVFYDKDKTDKIAGRTLIWKCDDGNFYNDRIYFTQDWYEIAYQNVCFNLGFKKANNSKLHLKIKLNNLDFRKYPYVDTFHYVSFKEKSLYNNPPEKKQFKYSLRNQNGYIQEIINNRVDEENNS